MIQRKTMEVAEQWPSIAEQNCRRPAAYAPTSGRHEGRAEYSYSRSGRRGPSLAGSCCGAGFGLLLLSGATVLLWLNEGVAVRTARSLDEAQASLHRGALSDAPVGALVHVSAALTATGELEDKDFGVRTDGLLLRRVVEVHQWRESKRIETRKVRGRDGQMLEEKLARFSYDSV